MQQCSIDILAERSLDGLRQPCRGSKPGTRLQRLSFRRHLRRGCRHLFACWRFDCCLVASQHPDKLRQPCRLWQSGGGQRRICSANLPSVGNCRGGCRHPVQTGLVCEGALNNNYSSVSRWGCNRWIHLLGLDTHHFFCFWVNTHTHTYTCSLLWHLFG